MNLLKKTILIIVGLFCILFNLSSYEVCAMSKWEEYNNSFYKLEYPVNWKIKEEKLESLLIEATFTFEEDGVNFYIGKSFLKIFNNFSREEFYQMVKEQSSATWQEEGVKILKEERIQFHGYPAYKVVVLKKKGQKEKKITHINVNADGFLIVIFYESFIDEYDLFKADFNKILDSIVLKENLFSIVMKEPASKLKEAIKAGKNLNIKGPNGVTPLMLAANFNKDPEIIKVLINNGAKVNARYNDGSITPLILAIKGKQSPEIISTLIEYGADVNLSNDFGWNSLAQAIDQNSDLEVIKVLVKNKVKINTPDLLGWTPLISAIFKNSNFNIIKFLINNGAKVNIKTEEGMTPLMFATLYNKDPKIITLLLNNGADANLKNSAGKKAFDYAVKNENLIDTKAYKLLKQRSESSLIIGTDFVNNQAKFRSNLKNTGFYDAKGPSKLDNLGWRLEVGRRYSSPVVLDDILYTTKGRSVYAIDNQSESIRWKFSPLGSVSSTPTVVGDTLYVGDLTHRLYAIDVKTGSKKWDLSLRRRTSADPYASPVVSDGVIYINNYGIVTTAYLSAVDIKTQQKKWEYRLKSNTLISPTVTEDMVFIGDVSGNLYALDNKTGEERWIFKTESIIREPVIVDKTLYLLNRKGDLLAVDMRTGKRKEEFKPDIELSKEAIDIETSKRAQARINTAPAVSNSILYVGAYDKSLYALDSKTGARIWKFATDAKIERAPIIADDKVYVGTNSGSIYIVDAKTGKGLTHTKVGEEIKDLLVIDNNSLYAVVSVKDKFYLYAIGDKEVK